MKDDGVSTQHRDVRLTLIAFRVGHVKHALAWDVRASPMLYGPEEPFYYEDVTCKPCHCICLTDGGRSKNGLDQYRVSKVSVDAEGPKPE